MLNRTASESLPSIHFTLDAAGLILSVSRFGAARLGYEQQELIGQSIFDLIASQDRQKLSPVIPPIIAESVIKDWTESTVVTTHNYRVCCKDGGTFWVKAITCQLLNLDPHPVTVLIWEELTPGNPQEEALRQLYEQTLRQAQREALLNHIVEDIRHSLDRDTILRRTVKLLLSVFAASRSIAGVCSEEDVCFQQTMVASAPGVTDTQGKPIPIEENPHAQAVLAQDAPVAVEDVAMSPLMAPVLSVAQVLDVRAILAVSIRFEGKVKGILCMQQCDRPRRWTVDEEILLKQVADQLAVAIQQAELYQQLTQANQELKRLATLDGLTQLANRRRFDEHLEQEWRRSAREQQPLSLILCDIDCFKFYNDTYGHQMGDECLKQIARALQQTAKRPADLVARYGGEEFAVILPNTPATGARKVAEAIRTQVKALKLVHSQSPASQYITLSLGVASHVSRPEESSAVLVAAADEALYQAKEKGRDRLVAALQLKM